MERMDDNRLAKIARDNHPQGVCGPGRPKKRWKESLKRGSLALNSGKTGVSLKRRLRRRRLQLTQFTILVRPVALDVT
jgi:hypothetical protein